VFQRMLWDTAVAIDPNARTARDSLFANPVAIPGGLAGFFQKAGLMAVEEQSLTIRMDYANFEDYWQPFLGGISSLPVASSRTMVTSRCCRSCGIVAAERGVIGIRGRRLAPR
jgi:hypothetical protein